MSQGTLVNSTHYSPSRQACQQFPGVLVNVCALPDPASAHTSRFSLCILPSCVHGRIASNARFGRRRPARLPPSQELVRVAADGAPSLVPFRPSLATRTLPAAAEKPSLPAQWWPSTSTLQVQAHLSPCDQAWKFQSHDVITVVATRASLTPAN